MLFRYLDTIGPSVMNVICIVVPVIGFVVGLLIGFGNRGIRVIEGALIIFFSFAVIINFQVLKNHKRLVHS